MRVGFDALMLTLFFRPDAPVHHKIPNAADRVAYFIEGLSAGNAKIVIPTPVLGEFLVLAGPDAAQYVAALHESDVFEIAPFDERAAIEAAHLMGRAKTRGDKRGGGKGTWQKIKVDWQLVAIAKVNRVDTLYSDDSDLVTLCETAGLKWKGIKDLPSPPPKEQKLQFDMPPDRKKDDSD